MKLLTLGKLTFLAALVVAGSLFFVDTASASHCETVCYDGRDCNGVWVGPKNCGARICGGNNHWWDCTQYGWQDSGQFCVCSGSLTAKNAEDAEVVFGSDEMPVLRVIEYLEEPAAVDVTPDAPDAVETAAS